MFPKQAKKYKFLPCRYQLIRDYTLKTLRLKIDKWNKLWSSDEQRALLVKFVETGLTCIIISSIFSHVNTYANKLKIYLQITFRSLSLPKPLGVPFRSMPTGLIISQIKGCISSRGRKREFLSLSMDLC